ncbi:MAG: hypothetical protein PHY40_01040 [Patescibacteria group bacterium]|nr:hypothetical protein [Patescibacteria group bacterium]
MNICYNVEAYRKKEISENIIFYKKNRSGWLKICADHSEQCRKK